MAKKKKRRTLHRDQQRVGDVHESQPQQPGVGITGKNVVTSIDMVKPNTFNYNKQSDFIFTKMKESLAEFGFVDPIMVRSANEDGPLGFFEVIGGEHRLKAAESMGYTEVPIRDLGMVSDVQAKKLCIVLNETKGKPDNDALASLITDINDSAGLDGMSVLPYEDAELDAFLNMGSNDWDDDDGSITENGLGEDIEAPKKKTIISVMGLLDISKKKEDFLIAQFEVALDVMAMKGKPVRAIEKMILDAARRYDV